MSQVSDKPRVYVSAFFCQDVIRDNRDLLTAVRISDAFIARPFFPLRQDGTIDENAGPIYPQLEIHMVIMFRSEQPGTFKAALTGTKPNGEAIRGGFDSLQFESKGAEGGYSLNINTKIPTDQEGVFWFGIHVDDELVTKVPLIIRRQQPQEIDNASGSAQSAEKSPGPSE